MHLFVTLRMPLTGDFRKHIFHFGFDARTSRGAIRDKVSWFIRLWRSDDPAVVGIGECGPLPGLSIDDRQDVASAFQQAINRISSFDSIKTDHVLSIVNDIVPPELPSVKFAFETALLDLAHGGKRIIFHNDFIAGKPIPINGLIWMADADSMLTQVDKKIQQGFTCIKLKVGGIDFANECDILAKVRKQYGSGIVMRLDANGAFSEADALQKLKTLEAFNIHSIEQPLKPGSPYLAQLCAESPIPIALDEELLGKENDKKALLEFIRPHYIILKPSLHGGLLHCREWISAAEGLQIGWWITSALESNIGLNAICQFTSQYDISLPQGLGTGAIYTDNFDSPLEVFKGTIRHSQKRSWELSSFFT